MKEKTNQYVCMKCGEKIRVSKAPTYCPFCGADGLERDNSASKKYGEEMILQATELVPQIEAAQERYISLLAQFENLMQKIRPYVMRGAIDPERVPKIEKITLRTALAEHRKKLREQDTKGGTKHV